MNSYVDSTMRSISNHWHNATPGDFGALALTIVITGWFFTRFGNSR